MTDNTEEEPRTQYTRTAVILHWLIGGLILLNIVLGFVGGHTADPVHRYALNFHKPIGMCVLILSLLRLAWRVSHKPPILHFPLTNWERFASRAVHTVFYVLMLALPMTGWLLSSAVPTRHAIGIPGLLSFPFLPVSASASTARWADSAHVFLAYTAVATIFLHLAGVVKHQVIDSDRILHRMIWPQRAGRPPGADPAIRAE